MLQRIALVLALSVLVNLVSAAEKKWTLPEGPFKALHLFNISTPEAEAKVLSVYTDLNAAVAKAGHPEIRYRMYKVAGTQEGTYAYLVESMWPGRAVYEQVHQSDAYKAVRTNPEVRAMVKDQVYNRLVEVTR